MRAKYHFEKGHALTPFCEDLDVLKSIVVDLQKKIQMEREVIKSSKHYHEDKKAFSVEGGVKKRTSLGVDSQSKMENEAFLDRLVGIKKVRLQARDHWCKEMAQKYEFHPRKRNPEESKRLMIAMRSDLFSKIEEEEKAIDIERVYLIAKEAIKRGESVYQYYNPVHLRAFEPLPQISHRAFQFFNAQSGVQSLFQEHDDHHAIRALILTAFALYDDKDPIDVQLKTLESAMLPSVARIFYKDKKGIIGIEGQEALYFIKHQVIRIGTYLKTPIEFDLVCTKILNQWCDAIMTRIRELEQSFREAKSEDKPLCRAASLRESHHVSEAPTLFNPRKSTILKKRPSSGSFEVQEESKKNTSTPDLQISLV